MRDRDRERQRDRRAETETDSETETERLPTATNQPTVRVSGLFMTIAPVYYSMIVTDIPTHPVTHQRPGQYNKKEIGFTGFKPKVTTNTITTSHSHMEKKKNNNNNRKV